MSTSATDDTGNYEYVTTRVRSRRAKLFDEDDYNKLVRMGPGEIARFMEETEYKTEMDTLGSRYSGVDLIEYALNRNLGKHFDDLLQFAEGKLYDYLARYLRKFDAWNVKTVIRGIYSDSDQQTVEDDLIRAGEFSDRLLDRLVEAGSIPAVVDRLENTIFGPELADALDEYEESSVLVPLENAVDRAFYSDMLDGLPDDTDRATDLYIQVLRAEIDFRNIRNALRLSRSGADIDPETYYISGGRLFDESELRQLINDMNQLIERIRQGPYGGDLEEALDDLEDAKSLIGFERALERALLEYSDTLSNRYPLSVCPIIAYIRAKEQEVDNIRAIARGKEAGLTGDEIEDELVIV
jgi:V/A-type H+-transporting ATPase subunit C